jgi:hypothetical protein
MDSEWVWIFVGAQAAFPGGVFTELERAEAWILRHQLSGTLSRYPVDDGVYVHALRRCWFSPRTDEHRSSRFIERFSSASLEHYHYEGGMRDAS